MSETTTAPARTQPNPFAEIQRAIGEKRHAEAVALAERVVAATDTGHELEPPAHGRPVDARVERGQPQLVDLPRRIEEA